MNCCISFNNSRRQLESYLKPIKEKAIEAFGNMWANWKVSFALANYYGLKLKKLPS